MRGGWYLCWNVDACPASSRSGPKNWFVAPLWHTGAVGRRGRDAYGPPSYRGRVVNDEKRHHKTAVEMDVLFFDMAPSWLKEPAQLRERARVPC